MIIYHGSKDIIKNPEFNKGNRRNDYGLGFYCTENIELAKEWACSSNDINGYVNKYEIELNDLKILNLNSEEYSILNWLAILLKYRTFDILSPIAKQAKEYLLDNFSIDIDDYDIIVGYRADDSYFSFAKDFLNNTISISQLSKAMYLGNLGTQIVMKSKKAFDRIKFIEYFLVDANEYYIKRITRDRNAREEYFEKGRNSNESNEIYVIDIIRRGLKSNDEII